MKSKTKNEYIPSIHIGLVPEWLLKAETGKGLWEHLISDEKFRSEIIHKIITRSQEKQGELPFGKLPL
ncbi:hypothetical protein FACS1894151_08760 [Spirochaetia bacterium]|nr:hypothetical protein FACS1894151_08760 [Spirochaetia bacterium]